MSAKKTSHSKPPSKVQLASGWWTVEKIEGGRIHLIRKLDAMTLTKVMALDSVRQQSGDDNGSDG